MGELQVVVKSPVDAPGEGAVFAPDCAVGVGGCGQGVSDQLGLVGDDVVRDGCAGPVRAASRGASRARVIWSAQR